MVIDMADDFHCKYHLQRLDKRWEELDFEGQIKERFEAGTFAEMRKAFQELCRTEVTAEQHVQKVEDLIRRYRSEIE